MEDQVDLGHPPPPLVFVSHLARERIRATEIAAAIRRRGPLAFVAHRDIRPAAPWVDEIRRSLDDADAVVALCHPGFRRSVWCLQEVGWALGRQIPIVSVHFGEDPVGFLATAQAIPGNDRGAGDIAKNILAVLEPDPRFHAKLAAVRAHRVELRRQKQEKWEVQRRALLRQLQGDEKAVRRRQRLNAQIRAAMSATSLSEPEPKKSKKRDRKKSM